MNALLFRVVALATCLATGMSSAPAGAHHSYAQFDTAKCQSIAGTVRKLEMTYPHVWLWLDTTDTSGTAQVWGFEGTSPVMLQRLGWNRAALQPGDKVTVRYSPLKDGRHGGSFASVQLSDGRQLQGGSPACTGSR